MTGRCIGLNNLHNILSPNIRLDEDVLIKKNIFALVIRLQKTFWSRPMYSSWPYIFKTFSRRLQGVLQKRVQDIFQTSSRHLPDVFKKFWRCLQDVSRIFKKSCYDVFKTSCKNVFKASSRHLEEVFKTSWKDIFKTFSRHIIKLNCSC